MTEPLRIIEWNDLAGRLRPEIVIEAVRAAFIRDAAGEAIAAPPLQLLFDRGDCHVKAGRFKDGQYFVIKVATGFYENPQKGLPVNDGLVLVFDSETGRPTALLQDHGWLTSLRTAAAGALAAELGEVSKDSCLGIVGGGHQARLQAEWISAHLGMRSIRIWARSSESAAKLASELRQTGLDAQAATAIEALCDECRLIVTCTPAQRFILPSAAVQPGTHIVALGADSPGKQELDPALFARAGRIFVDNRDQCADHGDLHYAPAEISRALLIGDALNGRNAPRDERSISIADLTGIPAQDVAIAQLALETPFPFSDVTGKGPV